MLRLTRLTDYAIIIMTYFAANSGSTYNARDISRVVNLPLPVVSKILKLLAKAQLLTSHRGTKGGYGLAYSPREITVATIIHALEGPIAVTECTDRVHGDCILESGCPVRTNWNLINDAIHAALERITLAEMTQPIQPLVSLTLPPRDLTPA
jgi:FeS assembly SUF system regulator